MYLRNGRIHRPGYVAPVDEQRREIVLRLLAQNIAVPAIAKLTRLSKKRIARIRKNYGQHIDRTNVYIGMPGTGDFEDCPGCKRRVRMPCMKCAILAMRQNPEGEGT